LAQFRGFNAGVADLPGCVDLTTVNLTIRAEF
jgi:hypothetical protein